MIEYLDLFIFHLINQTLANPFFDWLMPLFDKPKGWIPFILIFWLYMAYRDQKYRKMLLILVPLTILCCDQFGGFIKDFGLRDRPWFALGIENMRHLGGIGGKHASFPSNHASNISGIAFLFSFIYPHLRRYFWRFVVGARVCFVQQHDIHHWTYQRKGESIGSGSKDISNGYA